MQPYIVSYLICALVFLGGDAVWLSSAGNRLYRPILGDIMLDQFSLAPAVVFYFLYVLGIVIFAIAPAFVTEKWTTALFDGALFGLFAYATYDLSNHATLRNWSLTLTLVDMSWGIFLTAASAAIAYVSTATVIGAPH
jgi:uncharacterized membrane protein